MPKGIKGFSKGYIPWNKGKHISEETKKKIGLNGFHYGMKGKHLSEETRKKMSEARSGEKNCNFGKHFKCSEETKRKISEALKGRQSPNLGRKFSEEVKKKMSLSRIGKHWKVSLRAKQNMSIGRKNFYKNGGIHPLSGKKRSEETKEKIRGKLKGIKISIEARKKRSLTLPTGDKHHNWKGGITSSNEKVRHSIEIRLWREAVFTRDCWICKKCKIKSGKGKRVYLHAHHIENFYRVIELRTSIENGITFCKECHRKFHKIYGKKNNTKEQIMEFLNFQN